MHYLIASYNNTPTLYEIIVNNDYQVIPHPINSIPSYMIKDDKYIYVANKSGGITIYDFKLHIIAEYIDNHPYTHICVNNTKIMAVSYKDGITSLFEYTDTLIKLSEYQHTGSYHDPHLRQESAHPHFITNINDTTYLLCDLGRNALITLINKNNEILEDNKHSIVFKNICGPRHLHFLNNEEQFILVNEVNNTLSLLSYLDYKVLDTLSLGEDTTKLQTITHSLSAIRYDETHNLYYISDRNHVGISKIWIIKVNNKLEIVDTINVGKHPRDIYIHNSLLLVTCMLDDSIEVYDIESKELTTTLSIKEPVCILPFE